MISSTTGLVAPVSCTAERKREEVDQGCERGGRGVGGSNECVMCVWRGIMGGGLSCLQF